MSDSGRFIVQMLLLVVVAAVLVAAAWWMGRQAFHTAKVSLASGQESCLGCHSEMVGFSAFHNPASIGCASCHLGNIEDPTEAGAHSGMVLVPGNLSVAQTTCGEVGCHPGIVERVEVSPMATGRGIVAVDRFVFGEQATPNGTVTFAELGDSHADHHLKQLCVACHLGREKEAPAPVTELSRGGGCVACHVQYDLPRTPNTHPRLSLDVGNKHCFGCHSRSGRISTSYEGWHETLLTASEVSGNDPRYRLLQDGRVFEQQPPDAHHVLGLACIDCHTARETMGDGRVYAHQDEQVELTCSTCHATEAPATLGWEELDEESQKILLIRHQAEQRTRRFLTAEKTGRALTNVFLDEQDTPVLETKQTFQRFTLTAPAEACTRAGHERLSCQSCHSAWVPQCVGCHTQQDEEGRWLEFMSDFYAEAPTLGVRENTTTGTARIEPFAPGMIMTLNTHRSDLSGGVQQLAEEGTFHRLFAPAVPHTTSPEGRACESCHNDPLALGFGRGTLTLDGTGTEAEWRFEPTFASLRDGLPADAWTPFLETRTDVSTTRIDARPFSREEQQRILRVGTCLPCHDPASEQGKRLYQDFQSSLEQLTPSCKTIF